MKDNNPHYVLADDRETGQTVCLGACGHWTYKSGRKNHIVYETKPKKEMLESPFWTNFRTVDHKPGGVPWLK